MTVSRLRNGYVFLMTVLFIGAIALGTTMSLMLLGSASQLNGEVSGLTAQSLEWARTCIDHSLLELRRDLTYAGGETLRLARRRGACTIEGIGGSGNENRTICVSGETQNVAGTTRRQVLVSVERVFPAVMIDSYQETLTNACR